jgi:uncharacterized protein (TIRG00374 family)
MKQLWAEFLHARYIWIIFSLLFLTTSHFIRAYRWNLLIGALHYKPALIHTFYAVMIGYTANYAFPRIGEITKCGVLAKTERIPADKLLGTVIIERVVDLITLLIFMVILITARFEFFSGFIKPQIFEPLGNLFTPLSRKTVIIWILIITLPILFTILAYRYRSYFVKWSFANKIKDVIKGVLSGLKTVYTMKKNLQFVIFSFLIWIFYWLMTYIAFFALPSTADLKIIDGLFILVIGGFAFVAPVQGGIGAFHWIVSVGLSLYGISKVEGLAFATIIHGSQLLWTVLLGFVSMIILASVRRQKITITP